MKKMLKKSLAVGLATLSVVSVVGIAGCKKKPAPNTPADIEIIYWEAGYGRAFMDNLIEAFEEKYPHYNVTLEATASSGFTGSKLSLGEEYNTTDIMMDVISHDSVKDYALELTDIYNYKNSGESKTIAQKLGVTSEHIKYDDGKYYYMPHVGGLIGIAYNADIINGSDYVVPKTTNELIQLASDLQKAGKKSFIHFTGGGYWMDILRCWAGQYETQAGMIDIGLNPTKAKLTSKDSGMYQATKVMEALIGNQSYLYSGSNTLAFTDAQTYFLEGKAVMMANGAWLENEMVENYEPGEKNFSMMKAPVISSIINKCTTIENDTELSALVEAIDFGLTDLEGAAYSVNQEDFDRVKEARSLLTYNALGHAMCIPSYSNAIEASKEFLKFYYSDEGIKIFEETTKTHHVANYAGENLTDRTDFSAWANNLYELTDTSTPYVEYNRAHHRLFRMGCTLEGGVEIIKVLSAANPGDRLTADGVWTKLQENFNKNWNQWWANIGLTPPQE